MKRVDLIVIGAGPAGLSAAIEAASRRIRRFERDGYGHLS